MTKVVKRAGSTGATILLAALWLIFLGVLYQRFYGAYIDDAFISFRYADNLASGHGLVFNPGERVEGYTNFLWVVVLAALSKLGVDIPTAASLLSMVCGALLMGWMVVFSQRRALSRGPLVFFGASLLLTNSSFQFWVAGGLETVAYTLALFAGAVLYVDSLESGSPAWPALSALFVASLLRPDGVMFLGAVAIHHVWRSGALPGARACAPFVLLGLGYMSWRYAYFGDLLPNTFYQKTGGGLAHARRGLAYLWDYVDHYRPLALLPIGGLALRRPLPTWIRAMAAFIVLQLAYVILVGGDGLNLFRFLVPILPFVFLLSQEGLMALGRTAENRWARGRHRVELIGVALWALILVLSFDPYDHLPEHNRWIGDRVAVGIWLRDSVPAGSSIALNPIGAVGYYSELPVVDMLGLTDRHIARMEPKANGAAGHDKGDGAYVLSREPDLVFLGNVAVGRSAEPPMRLTLLSEHEIWRTPAFHELYQHREVAFGDRHLRVWERRGSRTLDP